MPSTRVPLHEQPRTYRSVEPHARPVGPHVISGACIECWRTFPDVAIRSTARALFSSVTHLPGDTIAVSLRGESDRRFVSLPPVEEPEEPWEPGYPAGQAVLDRTMNLRLFESLETGD